MTQHEPDWADEVASLMTPWPLDMRTMTVTLTSRAVYDFRDTIAAALRAERSPAKRMSAIGQMGAAEILRDRIRAGDQPGEPMREVTP